MGGGGEGDGPDFLGGIGEVVVKGMDQVSGGGG